MFRSCSSCSSGWLNTAKHGPLHRTSCLTGRQNQTGNTSIMAEANSYEITEPENRNIIETFGMEVELTTFKSNVRESVTESLEQKVSKPEVRNLTIICVGNDSKNWDKMVYVKHYLNEKPHISDSHRTVGAGLASKELTWPHSWARNKTLKLRFVVFGERVFDSLFKAFMNHTLSSDEIIGVMVFWGPRNPSSLNGAVEWKRRIEEAFPDVRNHLPFLLITDNISSVKWIGSENIMGSIDMMGAFCQENGFLKWFEILKSDWRLGDQNDVGRAIDWLLNKALDRQSSDME